MQRDQTGNNQYLKAFNQAHVLDLIRINKAISRTQLSKLTGLSATAIGLITLELIKTRFIMETDSVESTGGRKQILLELNPTAAYSIGIDFETDNIKFVLINIASSIVKEENIPFPKQDSTIDLLKRINLKIIEIIGELSISKDKLMGIGLSIPGLVNIANKEIIFAPNLHSQNIKLRNLWETISDIPLYVINEAKASAICEHWIGCCQGINDFVCINIKSGIGSGIYANGRLYTGLNDYAGEIGHITVDEDGPLCECGKYGCLETLASTTRIVELTKKKIRQGCDSVLNNINIEDISLNSILRAAKENDQTTKSILLDSARYLAIGISNLVNTLNPEVIVIGKEFINYSNLVLEHIKKIVNKNTLKHLSQNLKIMSSELGENTSALGAAIIPIQNLFGESLT